MALPTKTAQVDVEKVCEFLARKPTGSTLKEAKQVLDGKYLDTRKMSALRVWGFLDSDTDRLSLSEHGRAFARGDAVKRRELFGNVLRACPAYQAVIERVAHRQEKSLAASDIAAHWHKHFKDESTRSDNALNEAANTFFQIANGTGLGSVIVGRRGAPTRFEFDLDAVKRYLGRESGTSSEVATAELDPPNPVEPVSPLEPTRPSACSAENGNRAIFLGHGPNKKPLESLKRILDQFKIQYRIATEEPNLGRPIGKKVTETMRDCNCAILLFTADQCLLDNKGNEVWRPSENVVHELGACSFLYEDRVVVLKEDRIQFPTNFRDLCYIEFSEDGLDAKAMDILKELVGFGILRVTT